MVVLNITAQTSAQGAQSYFAQSDYYAEGQEIVGRWGGRGAVLLGQFGQVEQAAFNALCENRDPRSGKPLTPVSGPHRRVGYDFTWSAPKSVSLVHAITGDERIVDAFRQSVQETMSELEAETQTRVRRGGADTDRTSGNLLWAEFVHLTSRPVDGLPCPQLHSHCFALNATFDPVEERWKAAQFGRIKTDAYYWQAVQQARFADRLQQLGYTIRKTHDAFEIDGIDKSTLEKFSLRTQVIDRVAEQLGITDTKAKAKLAATTREAKLDSVPYTELVQRWQAMLEPAEREAVDATRGTPQQVPHRDGDHVRYAVDHSFERSSVVDRRRLLTLALRHGIGEVTPEGVRAAAGGMDLLSREEDGRTWVTTRAILQEETRLIRYAAGGKGTSDPIVKDASALRQDLSGTTLSGEQQAAVAHVLTTPDRVMVVRGVAGSGKTTLTREAVKRIEAAGKSVVMLAPSAEASRGVLRGEGFAEADTLARFLLDPKMQAAAQNGVIWLDEAGLVGCRTLGKLFDAASSLHAQIVLAGDRRQMAAVERGSPLRLLEDAAGLKIAEVTDIRRQSGAYKEAVKCLSQGDAAAGLDQLEQLGWVKQLPESDPYAPVAHDYVDKLLSSPHRERGVLIISPTHAEAAKITAEVRHQLKDAHVLQGEERTFTRLVPLQWTEAEKADHGQYGGEEVVQLHRNAGAFLAGQRISGQALLSSDRQPSPGSFSVYAQADLSIAPGELLRVTANGKTKDGKHKLNNGAVYAVDSFTADGDLRLSNGWVVDQSFGHLAHGYVSTAHAAQGRTIDHVIVVQSELSRPAATREGFYVAVSRGRKSAVIWTDDKEQLKDMAARSPARLAASDLSAKPKPLMRRMRDTLARVRLAKLLNERLHATVYAPEPNRDYTYAR